MSAATDTEEARRLLDGLTPGCEVPDDDQACSNMVTHIVTVAARIDGRLIGKLAVCAEHVARAQRHRAYCPMCIALIDFRAEPLR